MTLLNLVEWNISLGMAQGAFRFLGGSCALVAGGGMASKLEQGAAMRRSLSRTLLPAGRMGRWSSPCGRLNHCGASATFLFEVVVSFGVAAA